MRQHSQAQRILWLLEELAIPYNLVKYDRLLLTGTGPGSMAALKEVHSIGHAPILVTSDGRTIAESAAIIAYLLRTYGGDDRFATEPDPIREEQLLSFAISTMLPYVDFWLILELARDHTPWPLRWIPSFLVSKMLDVKIRGEVEADLQLLEGELGEKAWFSGDKPSKLDFIIEFPMALICQRNMVDLTPYPKVKAWIERVYARDAWKASLDKGCGYELTFKDLSPKKQ